MISSLGADACRAVADVEEDITDVELERLHASGVRAIRINTPPIQPLTHGLVEETVRKISVMEPKCRRMGWSIDFLFADWLTCEMIPYLDKMRVPFTLAHIGMNKGCHSTTSGGFRKLVDFLQNGEGYCWIKLTAPYRCSLDPNYADIVPLAQEVIAAAPDRVIWGSDIPHMGFADSNSIQLFNLLMEYAPDEKDRKRILVDNPAVLYQF
jgi:predicted TIM-barrel fold metal-dependent hydrolase